MGETVACPLPEFAGPADPILEGKGMGKERAVSVKCHLLASSFPTELLFRVKARGGDLYGIAPLHYCFNLDGSLLREKIAPGTEVEGLVAGVELSRPAHGWATVYLPDGQLYDVSEGDLVYPLGAAPPCSSPIVTSSGPSIAAS